MLTAFPVAAAEPVALDDGPRLGELKVADGEGEELELSPDFDKDTFFYTLKAVANDDATIVITAEADDEEDVTVFLGETEIDEDSENADTYEVTLEDGFNIITVTVSTEDDGETAEEHYLIVVFLVDENGDVNDVEADAHLKSLSVHYDDDGEQEADLKPAFAAETLEYTAEVPEGTDKIEIKYELEDGTMLLEAEDFEDEQEVNFENGPKVFPLTVIAEDGSVNVYKVTVDEESENLLLIARLTSLELVEDGDDGITLTLDPEFAAGTFVYKTTATGGADVEVKAVAAHDGTVVVTAAGEATVEGNTVTLLEEKDTEIIVTVTAKEGDPQATQAYTITVSPAEVEIAKLDSLKVTDEDDVEVELDPVFDPDKFVYKATVGNEVDKVKVEAEADE
jgi:hypothetical protein